MLLVTGGKDPTVDPGNTNRLATRIRAAGGAVEIIDYPDVDHVGVVLAMAFPFRWIAPVLRDVDSYMQTVR